jgi:hypothetical protein
MAEKLSTDSAEARSLVNTFAERFREFESVQAVALAGSRGTAASDPDSDFDLYVYSEREIPVDFRRTLFGPDAEINNQFWETGDEAVNDATGTRLDIMYRSPRWIEDQLDRILVRHEASIGYTTCFWFNVLYSEALFDRVGWYRSLQQKARAPYPEELRRAIVAKNWPILRRNQSSYKHQIELALRRSDLFSVHHRVTALLASFFDLWFALERTPHPGEKRLLTHLPETWAESVRNLLDSPPADLLKEIDALLDPFDNKLRAEGLI